MKVSSIIAVHLICGKKTSKTIYTIWTSKTIYKIKHTQLFYKHTYMHTTNPTGVKSLPDLGKEHDTTEYVVSLLLAALAAILLW